MKLIVLGASGRCGSWVVRLARERDHDVTAVVRPESGYVAPEGVKVERGQVLDSGFVRAVLSEHRLVMSCLGVRRGGVGPWAKLLSPVNLVERAMRNLIDAMPNPDASRVFWISAGGAGSSRAEATWAVRKMIAAGNVGVAYHDLEVAERAMDRVRLNSLAVRPVTLLPGTPTGTAGPVNRYGLLSTVRRSDVAKWMLDIADGTQSFDGKTVLLGRAS